MECVNLAMWAFSDKGASEFMGTEDALWLYLCDEHKLFIVGEEPYGEGITVEKYNDHWGIPKSA